ncbi:hypothetical protein, partial [Sphingorhabdus sp.]|uniref:hypothetical protein n=1 Tax=Sphingorhabdus sp. TaxID=1902408 RepID=UPI0037C7DB27
SRNRGQNSGNRANLSPKCTDQVPATRISRPLDQNQRLMEVLSCRPFTHSGSKYVGSNWGSIGG